VFLTALFCLAILSFSFNAHPITFFDRFVSSIFIVKSLIAVKFLFSSTQTNSFLYFREEIIQFFSKISDCKIFLIFLLKTSISFERIIPSKISLFDKYFKIFTVELIIISEFAKIPLEINKKDFLFSFLSVNSIISVFLFIK
jgi:hypothetical protein